MAGISVRLEPETLRSLAFGSIGAGYAGIGTALGHPSMVMFVQNLTDATLMFSHDGVNDHYPLLANGYFIFDIASNKTQTSGLFIAEGVRVYVKRIGTPTAGSVYLSTFYGAE